MGAFDKIVPVETEKAIGKAVSNVSNGITKNIGDTVADLWYLIFGGITQAAEIRKMKYAAKLESMRVEIQEKIQTIPENKRVEPSIQIVAPALEKSKYCADEDALRSMFVNLITSSVHSDYYSLVQPCFATIIEQMTALDASNLSLFQKDSTLPIAQYNLVSAKGGHITYKNNVFLSNCDVQDIDCQAVSIASLVRLGLLYTDYDLFLSDENAYAPFSKTTAFLVKSREISSFSKTDENRKYTNIIVDKGLVSVTPLGSVFMYICMPPAL